MQAWAIAYAAARTIPAGAHVGFLTRVRLDGTGPGVSGRAAYGPGASASRRAYLPAAKTGSFSSSPASLGASEAEKSWERCDWS
ncbi:hypothetical protein GCM10009715_31940 [Paeniglutamicibacter psychrophenolicus]